MSCLTVDSQLKTVELQTRTEEETVEVQQNSWNILAGFGYNKTFISFNTHKDRKPFILPSSISMYYKATFKYKDVQNVGKKQEKFSR